MQASTQRTSSDNRISQIAKIATSALAVGVALSGRTTARHLAGDGFAPTPRAAPSPFVAPQSAVAPLAPKSSRIDCAPGSADERAACPGYYVTENCIYRGPQDRYVFSGGHPFDCEAIEAANAAFYQACGVNGRSGAICPDDDAAGHTTAEKEKSSDATKFYVAVGATLGVAGVVLGALVATGLIANRKRQGAEARAANRAAARRQQMSAVSMAPGTRDVAANDTSAEA